MKSKIFAVLILCSICIFPGKPPKLTFTKQPNEGFYWNLSEKVSYARCSVCGRDVPSDMGWFLVMYTDGNGPQSIAKRKAMFPYKPRRWFICMRCIVEKLGIKPDWQMPDGDKKKIVAKIPLNRTK